MTAGRCVIPKSQSWGTPEKYVNAVRSFFGGRIHLDPCSNRYSIVHADTEFMLPGKDGLIEEWNYPTIYVNPPYGSDHASGTTIKDWLRKCAGANLAYGSEVLALVPVATNTTHWKNYVFTRASAVCFLADTRLRFLECGQDIGKGAPMACSMIYWGERVSDFIRHFSRFGAAVDISALIANAPLMEQSCMKLSESGNG